MMYLTGRIALVPLNASHAEELYRVIDDSREALKNLVWAEKATLTSTRMFISHVRGVRNLIVVNGEIAGMIETWLPDEDGFMTLGYWLSRKYRGYGIMQLVVKYVSDMIVERAPIKAKIKNGNRKSYRILASAGFTPYGTNREWTYFLRPQKNIDVTGLSEPGQPIYKES